MHIACVDAAAGVNHEVLGAGGIKVHARLDELVAPPIPVAGELRSLEKPPGSRLKRLAVELVIPPVDVDDDGGLFDEGCGLDFVLGGLGLVFCGCIHMTRLPLMKRFRPNGLSQTETEQTGRNQDQRRVIEKSRKAAALEQRGRQQRRRQAEKTGEQQGQVIALPDDEIYSYEVHEILLKLFVPKPIGSDIMVDS